MLVRDIDRRFPSILAMERAAAKRVPKFAHDYLIGGIGVEAGLAANRVALNDVKFLPKYIVEKPVTPNISKKMFGRTVDAPFMPGPVGMTGLMWPRAVEHVARAAVRHNIPVGLSSFSTSSVEDIAPIAGDALWFQLYCMREPEFEQDQIDRAKAVGCDTMIVTIDIPTPTRRERDISNGLSVPPVFDLSTVRAVLSKPAWAFATLKAGIPRFRNIERYAPKGASIADAAAYLNDLVDAHVSVEKLKRIREDWHGNLIVKGVLAESDAEICRSVGVDAVVVSNHGGRQLDAAPTAPDMLPAIRNVVGNSMMVMADGGVRSGLDIARMIALGADFVLLGRAFVYAVAAAGAAGPDHAMMILKEELKQTLSQTGCSELCELADRRVAVQNTK